MKKSLIALAALSTIAGSVAAQSSSVTVYGRIDEGFRDAKVEEARGRVSNASGISGGGWTSSRLGVNISEDLGSGTKAIATWESNLTALEGSNSTSSPSSSSLGGLRQAFVGLDGKMGKVTVGNQYLPEYYQGITVAGTVNSGTGYTSGALGKVNNTTATTTGIRRGELTQSNNIQYVFPKIADVTLTAVYGNDANDRTASSSPFATDTDTKAKLMSLGANYAKGPLTAGLSYSEAKRENLAAATPTTTVVAAASSCGAGTTGNGYTATQIGGTGTTVITGAYACVYTQPAANTKQKNLTASTTYDLGSAKLFGYYADREVTGTFAGSDLNTEFKTYNVGVQVPFGKFVPFAMYGEGKQQDLGVTVSKPEFYQVGFAYNFSKRTVGYGYFNSYKDKESTLGGTNIKKADNTTVGVAHYF